MEPYRLPLPIEERLKARARRTGRSVAAVTREAVLREIDALEGYYLAASLARRRRARRQDLPPSTH